VPRIQIQQGTTNEYIFHPDDGHSNLTISPTPDGQGIDLVSAISPLSSQRNHPITSISRHVITAQMAIVVILNLHSSSWESIPDSAVDTHEGQGKESQKVRK
jgi:hypothetical protein